MEKWTLTNLPPEGHEDVGRWFWDNCFMVSEAEKDRLCLKDRWRENHRIWRGGAVQRSLRNKNAVTANLIFSNIQRTVANLTAKNPSAEVVSLDGQYKIDPGTGQPVIDPATDEPLPDDSDKKVTVRMKDWWNTTEQINVLVDSALNMEIYGITVEKAVLDSSTGECTVVALDPFSYIIAPGNWVSPNDAPYVGMATAMRPDAVDAHFDLEPGTTTVDEVYSILGEEREENRPNLQNLSSLSSTLYGSKTMHPRQNMRGGEDRSLVVELFIRDNSTIDSTEDIEQIVDGIQVIVKQKTKIKKYPGGIRVVTLANQGELVCSDMANPNVNPELSREDQVNTYLFDHYPYSTAVSYRDPSSPWGFAAAEQVGDLAEKVSELLSRMYRYLARVMLPPLILPQDTLITEDEVNNNPGLILTPITGEAGAGIRYVQVPNLPSDTVQLFNMLLGVFDRVYQIEDADRGDTPNRIVAASAIVALQERNQVLMRHKIRQVDYLIRQRGRMAISFFQNFGVTTDPIKVDDKVDGIRGLDFIGRKFQYVVESGSTITQTSLQVQEQAVDLFDKGAIDKQALLESLNFPNWRRIVERMAESGDQLDQAAQVFIAAGVPQEHIAQMMEFARQPQQGATA
jgi:hypothetical protein